jgi:hypothetical protein
MIFTKHTLYVKSKGKHILRHLDNINILIFVNVNVKIKIFLTD